VMRNIRKRDSVPPYRREQYNHSSLVRWHQQMVFLTVVTENSFIYLLSWVFIIYSALWTVWQSAVSAIQEESNWRINKR
jgi:hypothetical protein